MKPLNNIETEYSQIIRFFVERLNLEYLKLLRQILVEENKIRLNAFSYRDVLEKLKNIKNRLPLKEIFSNIFDSISSVFLDIDNDIIKAITKEFVKRKFPVPSLQLKEQQDQLKEIIGRNIKLIKAIQEKQIENLENAVLRAVKGGSSFDTVVDEVLRQSDRGTAYAEFVAKDQISKTYAKISKDRQIEAGFPGYIWQSTSDDRTRETHKMQDGKFFYWDKPPEIEPGRFLHPGEDYQCRCIAQPSFEVL